MANSVVVAGGGAAGMMAAAAAAEAGAAVTLIEPNERLGKKLNITGKGRCNLTNDTDLQGLLSAVFRNGRFLYSAFSRFGARDTMEFFTALGVELKTERGRRVFPVSDRAFDVSAALERRLRQLGVRIVRDGAVAVETQAGAVRALRGRRGTYPATGVILSTGGLSYPATGSTGDGYRIAAALGHTVTPLRGALVPLEGILAPGMPCRLLQGLSLKNVALRVYEDERRIYSDLGQMLFTHFGVSGPMVLSASALMEHMGQRAYRMEIDLKPGLDPGQLDRRILSDFEKNANADFQNALDALLPRTLIPVTVKLSGIPGRQKTHLVTRPQRQALGRLLKAFPVEITALRSVEEAIVTSGGVAVDEVEPGTMASRRVRGLYFAGEVLDVSACTGGFNLQIAWATGRLAGLSAAGRDQSDKGRAAH